MLNLVKSLIESTLLLQIFNKSNSDSKSCLFLREGREKILSSFQKEDPMDRNNYIFCRTRIPKISFVNTYTWYDTNMIRDIYIWYEINDTYKLHYT